MKNFAIFERTKKVSELLNIEFFDYLEAIRPFRTLESEASSLAILMNVKQQRPSSDLAEKSVQQIEFV